MPSKIKQFNFNGCKSLRKIVIGGEVEFEGKIDLSDTPITDKNDILKVNVVDSEQEEATTAPFKDAPDGITSNLNNLKKIRLKHGEPIATETDPIKIHIEGVHL